ncbi:hypothetical protein HRI_002561400 [Hibiscus trionum]|uniref:Reverse transcriptase domain-containing protein n=1 Tax=Hibiscus trionum TaxID=183268 RepID=A0A9W7I4T7_HIBTR|nr:hypothetical protein HRI_002561400 [Hibiscus trionum]
MSKAYDHVEWEFVIQVLHKLGFDPTWIARIFMCMSSVSYSVVLNGEVGECFSPSKGLPQGDPLSPFLLLICSEGLSSLLRQGNLVGNVKGFRLNRYAPTVTHLLFADDSIMFGMRRLTEHFISSLFSRSIVRVRAKPLISTNMGFSFPVMYVMRTEMISNKCFRLWWVGTEDMLS